MKKIFSVAICCLITLNSIGQTDNAEKNRFPFDEVLPFFLPDGDVGVMKLIADSLEYPKLAIKDGIRGRVVVKFAIDTNGIVTDIRIVKSLRKDLDSEALRLVGLLKLWRPGMLENKKVKLEMLLPITFDPDLEKENKVIIK